jgi:hypothetical protein
MPEQEFFTVDEVAKMLKLSRDAVSRRFEKEPGVIDLGAPGTPSQTTLSRAEDSHRRPKSLPSQEASGVTQRREESDVWQSGRPEAARLCVQTHW